MGISSPRLAKPTLCCRKACPRLFNFGLHMFRTYQDANAGRC